MVIVFIIEKKNEYCTIIQKYEFIKSFYLKLILILNIKIK